MANKWLVVGLGNPGAQYRGTPHNIGFDVIEALCGRWGLALAPSKQVLAMTGSTQKFGAQAHLMAPTTYMNLSGNAVGPYLKRHAMTADELVVIYDDIDLPLGRVRLREQGSHGGHKGMLSIINTLGTREIRRVRVGVQPDSGKGDTKQFVLSKLRPEERATLNEAAETAADAIETTLKEDFQTAMNQYNRG